MDGLPLYSGPVDHVRYGFQSLETEMVGKHPIEAMQKGSNDLQWINKLESIRRTYGCHLAMRLATEREMFAQLRRFPGLKSSSIGLDTVMGKDVSIEFNEYLNDQHTKPDMQKMSIQSRMEVEFALL